MFRKYFKRFLVIKSELFFFCESYLSQNLTPQKITQIQKSIEKSLEFDWKDTLTQNFSKFLNEMT